MSNYSDFFGVGSSGGGGGVPVNSYLPFLVTATGNPTGYDATTGLYTHPDGTFFLRTGNTISDQLSVYPDATNTGVAPTWDNVTTNISGGSRSRDASYDGNVIHSSINGNTLPQAFDTSGNRVAASDFTGGAIPGINDFAGITYNNNNGNYYAFDRDSDLVYEFDSSYAYTGNSFTPAGITEITAMQYYNNRFYVAVGNDSNVREYDSTWALTNTFNLSGFISNDIVGLGHDGTNFMVANRLNWITTVNNTFTAEVGPRWSPTGRLNASNNGLLYINNVYYNVYGGDIEAYPQSTTFGDGTARTDTDTSQPLFIRLK